MPKRPSKQARHQNAIEAAILNRVLDLDWTLNRRGDHDDQVSRSLCDWHCNAGQKNPSYFFEPKSSGNAEGSRNPWVWISISSWKKGSLGRGRSGTSAQSFVLCFSVFWGDFLLQISQKFLSETAPPMQAFSGKPLAKNPKTQLLIPWKIGMLICHLVTSRPLIFLQKQAGSPCNFATANLTAFILYFYLPLPLFHQ